MSMLLAQASATENLSTITALMWVLAGAGVLVSLLVSVIGFFMLRTLNHVETKIDKVDAKQNEIAGEQLVQRQKIEGHDKVISEIRSDHRDVMKAIAQRGIQ